jgi:ATP sulfurylase
MELLCTLGPSSLNDHVIKRLEKLNVALFRLNLSHTKISDVADVINFISERSSIPICLDTEGAQVRTGDLESDSIVIHENSTLKVSRDSVLGNNSRINFYPNYIIEQFKIGDFISIDFNEVLVQVVGIKKNSAFLRVLSGGVIGPNKAITIDRDLSLSPLTDKDRKAISIGRELGVRHFALSFSSCAKDIEMLRGLSGEDSFIIAKIESRSGVANFSSIATRADAILIDRGDLSREIPIESIPAIQKQIAAKTRKIGVKLYIATNLLESMINVPSPTRAEVNDIYNSMLDGADGLVLAAETAIGKYPVQCANMVVRIVNNHNNRLKKKNDISNLFSVESQLVKPHGGELVYNQANAVDGGDFEDLKSITVGSEILSDSQLLTTGIFSPLKEFMDLETLTTVLNENQLPDGLVWTMPIVFPVTGKVAESVSTGERIKLVAENGHLHSIMDLREIFPFQLESIAKKWFGTNSLKHPGVERLANLGDHFLAGPVKLVSKMPHKYSQYDMTPEQCRFIFSHKGWRHVVGFHTRNVLHKAHEYIQLQAIEEVCADGLFLSPVLGEKKTGDFLPGPIIKSYELSMRSGVYPKGQVVFGGFYTYSRYSGPREAVFTALCRKNMGCDYFIIGRDHTGVDNFYGDDDNRRFFEEVGDIGITPIYFDNIGFDHKTNQYRSMESPYDIEPISATRFRSALLNREMVPDWFVSQPIQEMLLFELEQGRNIFY